MDTLLEDLVIDRVDLCDEGANSEAFIELYKRKETSSMDVQEILKQMTPEHAKVLQDAFDASAVSLKEAQDSLLAVTKERDDANANLEAAQKELSKAKEESGKHPEGCSCPECAAKDKESSGNASFDQTETFKSMPKEVQEYLNVIKQQKEAAEEELRKAKDAAEEAKAIAKAKEFKAIPVEQDKLVSILKNADDGLVELLSTVNAALEGTVLSEVGKTATGSASAADAWSKIDKQAEELAKSANITKAKAVSKVIADNPELYREYLEGGAN